MLIDLNGHKQPCAN